MSFTKKSKVIIPLYNENPLKRINASKNKNVNDANGNRRKPFWNDFDYYREEVKLLTEANKNCIPDIHKRGFNAYQIDHMISIKWGFDNGIAPECIAHPSNCQMLWWKDNIRKSNKCFVCESNKWILTHNGK